MNYEVAGPPPAPVAMPGQRLPLGVRPDGELTRTGVAFAFVLATVAVFLAFPLGVLGIVLSNMGMNRVSTKPETARRLVAWSWAILAVTDSIMVLVVIAVLISGS
jgi:hypothetical protein